MTEVAASSKPESASSIGLLWRSVGVIVSPYKAYANVAARPRALGALALTLIVMIACQSLFLSTDTGKRAMLEQQVQSMESFGVTVTDEMYEQMQSRVGIAPYTAAASQVVVLPLMAAIIAGLLFGVFNGLLEGAATFKHVFAVVSHSSIVIALQALFTTPISYAQGEFTSATRLSVFVPMLEEENLVRMLLGAIDLFVIWWLVSLAIGLSVLYRRRTGPIAWGLLGVYAGLVVVITGIRTVF